LRKWLKRIGIGVAVVLAVAVLLLFDFVRSFQRSVPSYDGTVTVAGLTAPVQILRDRYAVPHIVAPTLSDAAFGLGYAHAQDRLWQMEMARRYIQGRLSELFGEMTLNVDTQMRALNLYGAAEEAVKHLTPEARRVLNAYAAGVNAAMRAR
jgi:penicillin amidase